MHTGFTCTRQTITERIRVSRSTVSAPAGDVVVTLERFLSVRVTDSDAIVCRYGRTGRLSSHPS